MAKHPGAKQSTTVDRTSALVAGGLALLAVVGVASVFSETIAGAWSPPAGAAASAERPAERGAERPAERGAEPVFGAATGSPAPAGAAGSDGAKP